MQCEPLSIFRSHILNHLMRQTPCLMHGPISGQMMLSSLLLLYTAGIAPFQSCFWDYSNPCHVFPTLYFDVALDCFFMVSIYFLNTSPALHSPSAFKSSAVVGPAVNLPHRAEHTLTRTARNPRLPIASPLYHLWGSP